MVMQCEIKVRGCWRTIAWLGIAFAMEAYSPAPSHAVVLAAGQRSHSVHRQANSQELPLAFPPSSWQGVDRGSHAPLQLAVRKAKLRNSSHKLRLHNLCSEAIELVIRFQNPQQNWVTQGEVYLSGNSSRYLTSSSSQTLELSNKLLYYHAISSESDLVWSGNGSHQYRFGEQTLDMRLHYSAIDVLDDYSLFILCAEDTP